MCKSQEPACVTWVNTPRISNSYIPKGLCLSGLHPRTVNPLPNPHHSVAQKWSILSPYRYPRSSTLPSRALSISTHCHAWITDVIPILCPVPGRLLFRSPFIHLITFCRLMLVNFSPLCFSITPPTNIH